MTYAATVFSVVAMLGSPTVPESLPPDLSSGSTNVEAAPSPSSAFVCEHDDSCPHPAQCRGGRCVVSRAYLDHLERGGRARTIAGSIVLGTGVLFGIASASLVGSAYTDGFDRSMAEAGYMLGGFTVGALVTGTIVLTVGQVKLYRWRALRDSTLTTKKLGSPFVIRF